MRQNVIDLCLALAADPLWVQGAGGNISWKEDGVLWVKASGSRFTDAGREEIFVPVDLYSLRSSLAEGDFAKAPGAIVETVLRPSIETMLHGMLPQRVVVHLHAVEILAHLVRDDAQASLHSRVPHDLRWVLIEYAKPGAVLAQTLSQTLERLPDTRIVFLGNHGVVIGADDVSGITHILQRLTAALATATRPRCCLPAPEPRVVCKWNARYRPVSDAGIQQLALDNVMFDQLSSAWALYPEQVVFLGPRANCFEQPADVPPGLTGAVFVRGVGVFAPPNFGAAQIAQLRCYYDVLARQSMPVKFRVLSESEVADLLDWDAEKYRMQRTADAQIGDEAHA